MEWARKTYSAARQSRHLVLSSSSETYRGRPRLRRDSACGEEAAEEGDWVLGAKRMGDAESAAERVIWALEKV